ncbi:HYR domain-containing protein, partial [Hugenholtzia roseola]|uniref:HYR domain-containing protein n=1 Tax=Hugenholtzia roseola TaxID=1002 RepID=UPI001FE065EE
MQTGATFTTPALSANTTYYVEQEDAGGCISIRTAIALTVNPTPAEPTFTGTTTFCNGSTTTLTATGLVTGATVRWYDAPTGGTLLQTGTSFTTSALSASTTYYVEQENAAGCISIRTAIAITVTGACPDIALWNNAIGANIPNGATASVADGTDFGSFDFCAGAVTRDFHILNNVPASGNALTLVGSPLVAISGSSDFSISAQPTSSTIPGGGSFLIFSVTYTPSTLGTQTAVISIASDDPDENPYTFQVSATATTSVSMIDMWQNVGTAGFSNSGAEYQSLAFHPTTNEPYVAFRDGSNGNAVTLMRFDGTNWVNVGTTSRTCSPHLGMSLAFHPTTHEPYVAYIDFNQSGRARVIRYDGAAWVNVGNNITLGQGYQPDLAFHPTTHEAHLVVTDTGQGSGQVLFRFNGSAWSSLGGNLSGNSTNYGSLAFHPSTGEPYVAYSNYTGPFQRVWVRRWDGTAWQTVSGGVASLDPGTFVDLAFNSAGVPHVVYRDNANGNRALVRRFNGTTWSSVGTFVSAGIANYQQIAFHPTTDEAYVAYCDVANANKTTVRRFDGTTWQNVGAVGFSAGISAWQSFAFQPSTGTPYVAYRDAANANRTTVMRMNTIPASEIRISGNGTEIVSGSAVASVANDTDFGSLNTSCGGATNVARTFTIENLGITPLTLTGTPYVSVSGTGAAHFSVSTQPSNATIGACGTEIFVITYQPTAVGTHTATVTVSNDDSDEGTYTFTISGSNLSTDVTPPMLTACPANIVLTAPAGSCATANWTAPTATDNCGTPTVSSTHNSGDIFPHGITTVTYTATDLAGNTTNCSFTVTVNDVTPPSFTACPANISLNTAAASCDVVATWVAPTASDNCGIQSVSSTHNSGDLFPLGTTVVTYTATDLAGLTSTCSFNVTVTDATPPTALCQNINATLDASGNITVNASQINNASSDNCTAAAGLNFVFDDTGLATKNFTCADVGNQNVTLRVTDAAGNSATCAAIVNVISSALPIANCQNITADLDASGNVIVNASALDNGSSVSCGGSIVSYLFDDTGLATRNFTCANLGANAVTLRITDNSGNTATCTATITVNDIVAPVFATCLSNQTENLSATCG